MVNIIDRRIAVDEVDEILDNLDDILLGQHAGVGVDVQTELLVDTVTANLAQVVTLVGEEQVLEHLAGAGVISRVSIAQLTVDVAHSLNLRVAGILTEGVEDNLVFVGSLGVLVDEHRADTGINDSVVVVLGNLGLALEHNLVTRNADDLTRILIDEVLGPALQHTGSELTTHQALAVLLIDLHLLSEVEDLKNILIALEADGAKQRGNGQLLLTVDVSIHHIVDVGSKLNPRSLERNDTGTVEHRTVGMHALTEGHTG